MLQGTARYIQLSTVRPHNLNLQSNLLDSTSSGFDNGNDDGSIVELEEVSVRETLFSLYCHQSERIIQHFKVSHIPSSRSDTHRSVDGNLNEVNAELERFSYVYLVHNI